MPGKSFFDKALDTAKDLGEKAKDKAVDNSDKIERTVDKAADFVDRKTKGKYAKQVGKATTYAHGAVDKLAAQKRRDDEGGGSRGVADVDVDDTPPATGSTGPTPPTAGRPTDDPDVNPGPGPTGPGPDVTP